MEGPQCPRNGSSGLINFLLKEPAESERDTDPAFRSHAHQLLCPVALFHCYVNTPAPCIA